MATPEEEDLERKICMDHKLYMVNNYVCKSCLPMLLFASDNGLAKSQKGFQMM